MPGCQGTAAHTCKQRENSHQPLPGSGIRSPSYQSQLWGNMCDVLSPSARVEHATYCITQMTWTILNLLTWPSIWVSMGTSQTTWDIEEVHTKVFKPMNDDYIHRTFHTPHLNLTEQWMYTIENVFLGCLRNKKQWRVSMSLLLSQLLYYSILLPLCVSWRFSSVTPWLHEAPFTEHCDGWFIYSFSMLMLISLCQFTVYPFKLYYFALTCQRVCLSMGYDKNYFV